MSKLQRRRTPVGTPEPKATSSYEMNLSHMEKAVESLPSRGGFFKAKPDSKNKVRILPNKDVGKPSGRVIEFHWVKEAGKKTKTKFTCPDTDSSHETCPFCAILNSYKLPAELIDELKISARYVFNLAVKEGEKYVNYIWEAPPTILRLLYDLAQDDDIGDFVDPTNGFDLRLIRSDSTGRTDYNLIPLEGDSYPVDAKILEGAVDIWQYYKPSDMDEMQNVAHSIIKSLDASN